MLNYLSVKNFALIEDLLLEFRGGLSALTGETGAGKTIVVEALGLALGDKASVQQVRKGAPRLTVTACFGGLTARFRKLLKELELSGADGDEEVLLRREVDAGGRSRAFVNDNPVSVATLARLGELLVHAHGQHEHQLLLKPAEQRELLDASGRLEASRDAVAGAFARWKDLAAEQQALSLSEQERAQRIDLYKFQLKELDAAGLKSPTEDEELERLLPQLKNAERLKGLSEEAYGLLYSGEGSALDNARRVKRDLESLSGLGADMAGVTETVGEALLKLEEAAAALEDFRGKIVLDPGKLDDVLSRMDAIAKLRRKYGPALSDVIAYRQKTAEDLARLENAEEKTRDLSQKLAQAEADLKSASARLTKERAAAARKLAAAVEKEFREVGLPRAAFDVTVTPSAAGWSASGADEVSFRFAPNPGEGMQPLSAVASGGELSRVMLALKSVLAKADAVPTLVFDEIDAGVGGALGGALGKKLARLGKTHQVLCITHLASIAACAEAHFTVEKDVRKDRTSTVVRKLTDEERVLEIARMFGGAAEPKGKSTSVQHARELLAESRS